MNETIAAEHIPIYMNYQSLQQRVKKLRWALGRTAHSNRKLKARLNDAQDWALHHTNADGDTIIGPAPGLETILDY